MQRLLVTSLLALFTQSNAYGAPIQIDLTVDLRQALSIGYVTYGVFDLPQPVSVQPGDSMDMSVHFLDGQRLRITSQGGQQFLAGWLYPDFEKSTPGTSNFTIENASLSFTNLSGFSINPLVNSSQTDGNAHIGPLFHDAFIPEGESITFSGYRARYDVKALEESPYYYSGVFLQFAALNGGTVTVVNEVPAPATLSLIVAAILASFSSRQLKPNNPLKATRQQTS